MTEIWRDIKDYEGLYQISNLGRVKNSRTGRILKPQVNKGKGYLMVRLYKDGVGTLFKIHRLVAEAFKPNPHNYPTVDHINRIRTDNRTDNLRWLPYGLQAQNRNSESQREIVKKIFCKPVIQYTIDKVLVTEYPSIKEASIKTGICAANICNVLKGKYKTAGGYMWKYKEKGT